jgi:hypothetical protein
MAQIQPPRPISSGAPHRAISMHTGHYRLCDGSLLRVDVELGRFVGTFYTPDMRVETIPGVWLEGIDNRRLSVGNRSVLDASTRRRNHEGRHPLESRNIQALANIRPSRTSRKGHDE